MHLLIEGRNKSYLALRTHLILLFVSCQWKTLVLEPSEIYLQLQVRVKWYMKGDIMKKRSTIFIEQHSL